MLFRSFLQSIPYAAANLKLLLLENIPLKLPHLTPLQEAITKKYGIIEQHQKTDTLTVRIYSFSYRKGIPEDNSTNGGGFVFDCRSLPNPGRIAEMQTKTGFDTEVKLILESEDTVGRFLVSATELSTSAIDNYLCRKFTDIMISFGCTGGQHRSVFCANTLAAILQKEYSGDKLVIDVIHRELKR